ncbi:MAG: thiamine ABC transporter substrate-binding protein [Chloroflexota bacterium]|nr:thiamine ABC transporter substrate-binding protein [Chloroflexota bacterium]MDE2947032.1 thiamine ABC transporter substrate-binding protein [Chloroflexota bacterium]
MALRALTVVLLILLALGAASAQDADRLVLLTHDSFSIPEEVLEAFEESTGTAVEILRSGDAGQMVNQAILSKNNPLGDLLYGVDNTFLSRALNAEIFAPYESPALEHVRADLIPNVGFRVTPVDYGDVCLNYDLATFEESGLALPASLSDLTKEAYRGLLVAENPATSSPGLAFLLATIAEFGDAGDYTYLDFWGDLSANDVLVVDGWSDAYYGEFKVTGRDTGTRPMVVSYASSPPAEVLFSEDPAAGAITGAIVADNMCFRQVEYVGVLAGAANEEAARQFVDFMLSPVFQEAMPLNMFVFPAREDVTLPEVFAEHALIPEKPAFVAPAEIEANREAWIQAWMEVMLR